MKDARPGSSVRPGSIRQGLEHAAAREAMPATQIRPDRGGLRPWVAESVKNLPPIVADFTSPSVPTQTGSYEEYCRHVIGPRGLRVCLDELEREIRAAGFEATFDRSTAESWFRFQEESSPEPGRNWDHARERVLNWIVPALEDRIPLQSASAPSRTGEETLTANDEYERFVKDHPIWWSNHERLAADNAAGEAIATEAVEAAHSPAERDAILRAEDAAKGDRLQRYIERNSIPADRYTRRMASSSAARDFRRAARAQDVRCLPRDSRHARRAPRRVRRARPARHVAHGPSDGEPASEPPSAEVAASSGRRS